MQHGAGRPPGHVGGFKTLRYIDTAGHECAFYDTALLFPTNAINLSGPSLGVAVLDMSDPAHPVQTDTLTELPMLSPHESLNAQSQARPARRGARQPRDLPGLVSIYDAHADCRHPVLQSTALVARFGHESGFSPDGKTFYAAGTAYKAITAIDVTDPKAPHPVWHGNVLSHGMSLSNDGNRAYIADASGGNMLILDTSEIQAAQAQPAGARDQPHHLAERARSRRTRSRSRVDGKPYVLEFDEYTQRRSTRTATPTRSAPARIIDISDEKAAARDLEPAAAGRPARRARGGEGRSRHVQPRRRATRRTTATSPRARTRGSSRARSSPRACGSSTSAT